MKKKKKEYLTEITEIIKKQGFITILDLCKKVNISYPTAQRRLSSAEINRLIKGCKLQGKGNSEYQFWVGIKMEEPREKEIVKKLPIQKKEKEIKEFKDAEERLFPNIPKEEEEKSLSKIRAIKKYSRLKREAEKQNI